MKRSLLLGALAIVLPCAGTPKKEPSFVEEAQAATLDALKDPESARFKWVRATDGTKLDMRWRAICGEVNAKNSHGGYTGFSRFVTFRIANYDFKTVIEGEDRNSGTPFAASWREYCAAR